jgi:energy-coupling factor transporter ATP-binding protein EcfA2
VRENNAAGGAGGRDAEVLVILGTRGSGKSSLAKSLLRSLPRVVIFDTCEEYKAPHVIRSGHPVELFRYLRKRKRYCVSYVPREPKREWPWVCRIAFALGDMMLCAEEVDQATSAGYSGPEFGNLLRRGRHRGVSVIGISRRPAEIPRELTANAYRIVAFRSTEPRDLAYYRAVMGEAAAERIRTLPPLTGYAWRDDGVAQLVTVDPARRHCAFRPLDGQAPRAKRP